MARRVDALLDQMRETPCGERNFTESMLRKLVKKVIDRDLLEWLQELVASATMQTKIQTHEERNVAVSSDGLSSASSSHTPVILIFSHRRIQPLSLIVNVHLRSPIHVLCCLRLYILSESPPCSALVPSLF